MTLLETEIIIVSTILGATFLFIFIIFIIWKVCYLHTILTTDWNFNDYFCSIQGRFGKKNENSVINYTNMDGIVPAETRRRRSGTISAHQSADIARAQKFRERARTVTVGRPKFKVTRKNRSFKTELSFRTLEGHHFPVSTDKPGVTFRRISEDRTSSFSVISTTDIESRGGPYDSSCPTIDQFDSHMDDRSLNSNDLDIVASGGGHGLYSIGNNNSAGTSTASAAAMILMQSVDEHSAHGSKC
jgi:hypothetical protein